MNWWIWRFADGGSDGFYAEKDELLKGRLRQGWGFPGGDCRHGITGYVSAWKAAGWPLDENEDSRRIGPVRRFKVLKRMLEIRPGDRIVIPRVSVNQPEDGNWFTIATVVEPYSFDVLSGFGDFGHIIWVDAERLRSYPYNHNADTAILAEKLEGKYPYGRAVSRIGDGNAHLRGIIEKLAQ